MKIKDRLAKLIDVKSLVTLILTAVFGHLSVIGKIAPEQFLTIYTVVVGFYFGVQFQKKSKEDNDDEKRD